MKDYYIIHYFTRWRLYCYDDRCTRGLARGRVTMGDGPASTGCHRSIQPCAHSVNQLKSNCQAVSWNVTRRHWSGCEVDRGVVSAATQALDQITPPPATSPVI